MNDRPLTNELPQIVELVDLFMQYLGDVDRLESQLSEAKDKLKKVQEQLLPDAIYDAGLSAYTTRDGLSVSVESDLSLSVPKARIAEITKWLKEHEYGDVVKEQVTADFSALDKANYDEVINVLAGLGVPVSISESVHPQTLKAILRSRMQEGEVLDLKFFGAYAWKKAVIKQ